MSKQPPPVDFDENPEWTAEDFASARSASEILPTPVAKQLVRSRPISDLSAGMAAQRPLARELRLAA